MSKVSSFQCIPNFGLKRSFPPRLFPTRNRKSSGPTTPLLVIVFCAVKWRWLYSKVRITIQEKPSLRDRKLRNYWEYVFLQPLAFFRSKIEGLLILISKVFRHTWPRASIPEYGNVLFSLAYNNNPRTHVSTCVGVLQQHDMVRIITTENKKGVDLCVCRRRMKDRK